MSERFTGGGKGMKGSEGIEEEGGSREEKGWDGMGLIGT